ncbi:MAG: hypothetical protein ACREX8_07430, partial [Gammaproteobacteria bacterium]
MREIEARQGSNQNIREGDRPNVRTRSQAATEAGLSEHQRKTALRIAAIPEEEFEAQIESDDPPTVSALAEQGTQKKPKPLYDPLEGVDAEDHIVGTWLIGLVRHVVREGALFDIEQAARGVKPSEASAL